MINVTQAAEHKVSVLGEGAVLDDEMMPILTGQLGLLLGDPDKPLLVVGTREELNAFADTIRYHLLDIPVHVEPSDADVACANCPHIQAGHAGADGLCLVMEPKPCPCVQFTAKVAVTPHQVRYQIVARGEQYGCAYQEQRYDLGAESEEVAVQEARRAYGKRTGLPECDVRVEVVGYLDAEGRDISKL